MDTSSGPYPFYRINVEQQRKRAKELLKAARDGEPAAIARFAQCTRKPDSPLQLADAQHVIARELRFDDWASLKHHVARLASERAAASAGDVLDADAPTLHVRCGRDLERPLREAGFHGDFHEHNYPYSIGPVHDAGPGVLEERARFLCETYGADKDPPLRYATVLASLERDERTLQDSARYARVVIWSEFDCYDQLVLVRLLAHYAKHARPPQLELIDCGDFPGAMRFIGLGHLPPEALRVLWTRRQRAEAPQLALGEAAWRALASEDPRGLASILRTGAPALPLLAPALHRHLRELPSTRNGLSFTEQMALELLAEAPHSLDRLFQRITYERDPLPGQGDLQTRDRILGMEVPGALVFTREPGADREGRARSPWTDRLAITELGRRVLAGEVDFRALQPRPRWVGGVRIAAGEPDWRWDDTRRDAFKPRRPGGAPTG